MYKVLNKLYSCMEKEKILNKRQEELLYTIINNNKCFDRRDNSFLLSNRKIAAKLKVSASKVDQLFRVLKKHSLVKKVKNTYMVGNKTSKPVMMLSPRFLWISWTKTDRYYCDVLYNLGSVEKADQWRMLCRKYGGYIDIHSGELDSSFTWHYIDEVASRYTCFDRCYRKGSSKESIEEDHNTSQGYNKDELILSGYDDQYDSEWFSSINKDSDHNYSKGFSRKI